MEGKILKLFQKKRSCEFFQNLIFETDEMEKNGLRSGNRKSGTGEAGVLI